MRLKFIKVLIQCYNIGPPIALSYSYMDTFLTFIFGVQESSIFNPSKNLTKDFGYVE